jgi:hypothetical protein
MSWAGATETALEQLETLRLEKRVDDLPALIHSSPQIVLLAIGFYEDFIDEEGVAIPRWEVMSSGNRCLLKVFIQRF